MIRFGEIRYLMFISIGRMDGVDEHHLPPQGHKICHRKSHDLAAAERDTRKPFTMILLPLHREQ